jgi:hypothetical protein
MGVRGNIGIQRLNDNQKSKRRKLYDKDVQKLRSRYEQFEDHTRMKTHEYADFQKVLFEKVRREKTIRRIRIAATIILTFLFLWSLPYLFSIIFFKI